MKNFLKNILSSFLAMILIFISFIVFIVFIVFFIPEDQSISVKDNSVLKIEFNSPILDRTSEDPFEDINIMDLIDFDNTYLERKRPLNNDDIKSKKLIILIVMEIKLISFIETSKKNGIKYYEAEIGCKRCINFNAENTFLFGF